MEPKVADDLLWGVEAIAKEIGQPVRQVYYMLEKGELPAGKPSGRIWVASRQALRKYYQELLGKPPTPAKCITNPGQARQINRKAKAAMKKAVSA
jgi:hypothetical protein